MDNLLKSLKGYMGFNSPKIIQKQARTRAVIFHAHIFKNAGTTLDWSLQRNFRKGFIDHRDDQKMLSGGDSYLKEYLNTKTDVTAISSHKLPMGFSGFDEVKCFTVVLLRHPILRIKSVYDFEHKQDSDTPGAINAKKMNFREYVQWRMQPSSGATIRSFQTRFCGGGLAFPALNAGEFFPAAFELITKKVLVGVVEQYDQSMVYFEHRLKFHFPEIDLSYVKQNTTISKVKLNSTQKITAIQTELGVDVVKEVYQQNACDLALYELVTGMLQNNLAKIENFEEKLIDLQQRNKRL